EQTYSQLMQLAEKQRLVRRPDKDLDETSPFSPQSDDAALPRCLMAGFIDQLCVRRDQGTLECELTEGRTGTLMRESVVQNATLFVAASIREVESRGSTKLTLLGLATAIKPK